MRAVERHADRFPIDNGEELATERHVDAQLAAGCLDREASM
jgi:hypothetical protein